MSESHLPLPTAEGASIMSCIPSRINHLDITLFEAIPSQTTVNDRRSLLAVQAAVATATGSFAYLEIGSHLGGSIQPYLLDDRCRTIVSIDKRPARQPDMRGTMFGYPGNSTERMLDNLRLISDEGVDKVQTFDADTSQLKPSSISPKPDICFIDGEHTNAAIERDFAFCLSVVKDSGVVCFHDSNIVFEGIRRVVEELKTRGKRFHAYNLPNHVFVIDFGLRLHDDPRILQLLIDNHLGYLSGLESMSRYRTFYNDWFLQKLRAIYRVKPIKKCSRLVRNLLRK